jgi:hypothetical protein
MDAAPFGALLGVLQKAPFCSDKIGIVSQLCASRAHRFHGRQCVDVLRDVPFVRGATDAAAPVAPCPAASVATAARMHLTSLMAL